MSFNLTDFRNYIFIVTEHAQQISAKYSVPFRIFHSGDGESEEYNFFTQIESIASSGLPKELFYIGRYVDKSGEISYSFRSQYLETLERDEQEESEREETYWELDNFIRLLGLFEFEVKKLSKKGKENV